MVVEFAPQGVPLRCAEFPEELAALVEPVVRLAEDPLTDPGALCNGRLERTGGAPYRVDRVIGRQVFNRPHAVAVEAPASVAVHVQASRIEVVHAGSRIHQSRLRSPAASASHLDNRKAQAVSLLMVGKAIDPCRAERRRSLRRSVDGSGCTGKPNDLGNSGRPPNEEAARALL